jgi:nicotinate-nucleotide pyrophosphorylase (carboxylating)
MDIVIQAEGIIRLALSEDLGVEGDITTVAVCPEGKTGKGILTCREPCRVAGQPIAARVFELAGEGSTYRALVPDGEPAGRGRKIGIVEGPLSAILAGERTALNFLCHLSGIASLTARLVAMAEPHGVLVMDTRKTTPGLRVLEKYAVYAGGGTNHRMGLFDGILIKDNHIVAAGGIELAVRRVRNVSGDRYPVEVEAATLREVREAVDAGADVIMLDNMDTGTAEKAIAMIAGQARIEVSGGVTPENFESYARLGVDQISLGFITHSAPSVDISLELEQR